AVVELAVAIVVEQVAALLRGRSGNAIRGIAGRAVARAPADPAGRADSLVNPRVAVVVLEVANLRGAGMDRGVPVVAVASARRVSGDVSATHPGRARLKGVVAVAVTIGPHLDGRGVLVDPAVAIVVLHVADVGRARVDLLVILVAVAV